MMVASSPNLTVQRMSSSLTLADLDLQMKERWGFPGCKEPTFIDYLLFVTLGYLYILSNFSQQVSELDSIIIILRRGKMRLRKVTNISYLVNVNLRVEFGSI